VFLNNFNLEIFNNSGVILDAKISQPLIESIFSKESPLHDGAMVVSGHKIHAASCILPVSSNQDIPKSAGLRHRAGLGATEMTDASVFIVSEESGQIAFAYQGKLSRNLSEQQLLELLNEHYK
ncbi:MAG: DNA integrity scanning protein DisA nucleotide-binding domain protein, partial [Bacteroidota bacterium]